MQVPFIELTAQYWRIESEIQEAVRRVFTSQQFILKDNVSKLEKEIAERLQTKHAVGLASGTDALYLSLLALGIGAGDEVITTPFTFFATAGTIARVGAKPVFADVDPKTFNLDPSKLESKITKATKAIIPVHLFGLSCDMDPILAVAKRHSVAVIEDMAQAYGTAYKKKPAGSLGDIACLSFFPTKNLGGAGDGGMVVTSSDKLADLVKLLRVHGSRKKYFHEMIGINSRLDEIQAAVVSIKLRHIDEWNAQRAKHAAYYSEQLKGLPLELPGTPSYSNHTFHLYSVLTERRDALVEYLEQNGVGVGVYYPLPLHLQQCFGYLGCGKGDFPVSERLAGQVLSLPMFPELQKEQLDYTVSVIRKFFR